jgi:hypothetical protein
MKPKGESHRIYWQQWLSSSESSAGHVPQSRRELITSSAAIRISPDAARARDVTDLLRDTLNLSSLERPQQQQQQQHTLENNGNGNTTTADLHQDSLVLVGTLYSLPPDYVQFEHEPSIAASPNTPSSEFPSRTSPNDDQITPTVSASAAPPFHSQRSDPFHVVKTLQPDDNPLRMRDKMIEHLRRIQESASAAASAASATPPPMELGGRAIQAVATIAPKIQWYFVPGKAEPHSPIPSCIDLDGYCTSMEEEDDDDDDDEEDEEDDDNDNGNHSDGEKDNGNGEGSTTEWKNNDGSFVSSCPWSATTTNSATPDTKSIREQQRIRRELRRYIQLGQCQSAAMQQQSCVSGFLLKRSRKDPHVWRRVHCILTEDYLWYVTRIQPPPQSSRAFQNYPRQQQQQQPFNQPSFRMARHHGRIDLLRALLLEEPSSSTTFESASSGGPLYRIPDAFEIVNARGTSHIFRASCRKLQSQWVHALSDRIVQRFENSLMALAEMIVADECVARNKRMASVAVQPLNISQGKLQQQQQQRQQEEEEEEEELASATTTTTTTTDATSHPPRARCENKSADTHYGLFTKKVLRLGMQVSQYRERCRHVKAILPAKQPVVVVTKEVPNSATNHKKKITEPALPEPLDPETKEMVLATWRAASSLLARATQVAMDVQASSLLGSKWNHQNYHPHHIHSASPSNKEGKRTLSRSLETLCRHVDYVITGQFRQLSDGGFTATGAEAANGGGSGSKSRLGSHRGLDQSHDPPPIDLFDLLLAELQSVAAVTDYRLVPEVTTGTSTANGDDNSTK